MSQRTGAQGQHTNTRTPASESEAEPGELAGALSEPRRVCVCARGGSNKRPLWQTCWAGAVTLPPAAFTSAGFGALARPRIGGADRRCSSRFGRARAGPAKGALAHRIRAKQRGAVSGASRWCCLLCNLREPHNLWTLSICGPAIYKTHATGRAVISALRSPELHSNTWSPQHATSIGRTEN